ncbi:TPA: dTDP-glucose 4,6-dehydratase [Candidatus Woesearchaeota archaeon]|nr:dTDP-glucose 4,6-dehydratase [Candidatus Woesearchaeota archaeon]
MKTILVTGGAGFIGSNFIRYLLEHDDTIKVINLDVLTYCGNLENLRDVEHNPRYEFVQGDITDPIIVNTVMPRVEAVIHFAAESHVDNSIKDPVVFTKTNVLGTHVLVEVAHRHKVKRFLHMSTDEVYGSIITGSFTETDPLHPNSPYSASKAAAELVVQGFQRTFGFPAVIVRCSNAFGPYQYPEKVIPLFVTNLLECKKVPLYGDGRNIRDWIYVVDVCRAVEFIFRHGREGEIYNIAGTSELENRDLTSKLLSLLGKDDSSIQHVPDRLGHDRRYSVLGSKLAALGWKPQFGFENALQETVQWYRDNVSWWQKLKK